MNRFATCGCVALMAVAGVASPAPAPAGTDPAACSCAQNVEKGIADAIRFYVEGSRKGDSRITRKAFAPGATMSWSENGRVKTVPIQSLYDWVDKTGAMTVTHKEIKLLAKTDTTAVVSVDTQFGKEKYTDMFAFVRDGGAWKIVAKIYHTK